MKFLNVNITSDSDQALFEILAKSEDGTLKVLSSIPDSKAVIKSKMDIMVTGICIAGDIKIR
jgi:hypothetical protein